MPRGLQNDSVKASRNENTGRFVDAFSQHADYGALVFHWADGSGAVDETNRLVTHPLLIGAIGSVSRIVDEKMNGLLSACREECGPTIGDCASWASWVIRCHLDHFIQVAVQKPSREFAKAIISMFCPRLESHP